MNRHHHQTQHHHRMYSFHSRDSSCSTLIGLNFIGEEQQEQFIHSSTHTPHYVKEKNNEPPLPCIEIHKSVTNEEKDRIHPLSISNKYAIQKNNKKETNKSLNKKKKKKKMKSNNADSSSFPMSIYRKLPLLLPPPPAPSTAMTTTTTQRSSLLEERSHSLEYSPDHSSCTNNRTIKRLWYKHKDKVKVEEREE